MGNDYIIALKCSCCYGVNLVTNFCGEGFFRIGMRLSCHGEGCRCSGADACPLMQCVGALRAAMAQKAYHKSVALLLACQVLEHAKKDAVAKSISGNLLVGKIARVRLLHDVTRLFLSNFVVLVKEAHCQARHFTKALSPAAAHVLPAKCA